MIRKLFFALLFSVPALGLTQESLSLETCYSLAIAHHPLGEKQALLSDIHERELDNLQSGRLPDLNLFALAGVQSETVEFPFENPMFPRLDLPLYRGVAGVQVQYAIYDGGYKKASETIKTAGLQADLFEVEVELDQLKQQVNQLFFGLQLQAATGRVLELNRETLVRQIRRLEVQVESGVALPGQIKRLRVRLLELDAALEESARQQESLAGTLGRLLGREIDRNVRLENPSLPDFSFTEGHDRLEPKLLQLERERIAATSDLLTSGRKPIVTIGGTAGAGYPNQLNLFDVSFRPYATAEVRMNWTITDWGKTKREGELLSLRSQLLENQEEVFDYQIDLEEDRYRQDILNLEARLVRDQEILQLQEEVLAEVATQLDNGIVTSTEFIEQLNKRLEAQLQLEIHEIHLIRTRVHYLTHKGLL